MYTSANPLRLFRITRNTVIAFLFSLLFLQNTFAGETMDPATIEVTKGTPILGLGTHYSTVSDALTAAAGSDVIEITDSSVYPENITISTSDITIRSSWNETPVIEGPAASSSPVISFTAGSTLSTVMDLILVQKGSASAVSVSDSYCELTCLLILQNSDYNGIDVNMDSVSIGGCRLMYTGTANRSAIYFSNATAGGNAKVGNNMIGTAWLYGINFAGASTGPIIANNSIFQGGSSGTAYGIYFASGINNCVVKNNAIMRGGASAGESAIYMGNTSSGTVENNGRFNYNLGNSLGGISEFNSMNTDPLFASTTLTFTGTTAGSGSTVSTITDLNTTPSWTGVDLTYGYLMITSGPAAGQIRQVSSVAEPSVSVERPFYCTDADLASVTYTVFNPHFLMLQPSSPFVDSGGPLQLEVDIMGKRRFMDGDSDLVSEIDRGAHEVDDGGSGPKADLMVYDGGDGTWDSIEGDTGYNALAVGGVSYEDANTNGIWDSGEAVWVEGEYPGSFDDPGLGGLDTLLVGTAANGTTGITQHLLFHDLDADSMYDAGEEIWFDSVANAVFTPAPVISISGYVYDSATTTPITDAYVDVYEKVDVGGGVFEYYWAGSSPTNASGYYEITDLTDGNYIAEAGAQSYEWMVYDNIPDYDSGTVLTVTGGVYTGSVDFYLFEGTGGGSSSNLGMLGAEISPTQITPGTTGQTFQVIAAAWFDSDSNGIDQLTVSLPNAFTALAMGSQITVTQNGTAVDTLSSGVDFTATTSASGSWTVITINLFSVWGTNLNNQYEFTLGFTADSPVVNNVWKADVSADNTSTADAVYAQEEDANGDAMGGRLFIFGNSASNVLDFAGSEVSPHTLDTGNPNALVEVLVRPEFLSGEDGFDHMKFYFSDSLSSASISSLEIAGVALIQGTDFSYTTGTAGGSHYLDIAFMGTYALIDATYDLAEIRTDVVLQTPTTQIKSIVRTELYNTSTGDNFFCEPLYSLDTYDLSLEVLDGTWGGNEGSISGTVYDSATTSPLTGGAVDIYDSTTGTFITGVPINTDGTYYAGNLADGTYDLEASSTGYQPGAPVTVEVNVGGNAGILNIVQDLSLSPNTSTNNLDGWVFDSDTDTALNGAQASLYNAGLSATSDTTGWFSITGVPFNHLDFLKFAKVGYVPQYTYFFNSDNYWKMPHNFYLETTTNFESFKSQIESLYSITIDNTRGMLLGKITDFDETTSTVTPLSNAQVQVAYTSDGTTPSGHTMVYLDGNEALVGPTQTTTSSSGLFIIVNLPTGKYDVTASLGTDSFAVRTARVFANSLTDGMIQRLYSGGITGTVTDPNNTPLQGAEVGIYKDVSGNYTWIANVMTDGAGVFSATGLPAGTYVVDGWADGYYYVVYDNAETLDAGTSITVGSSVVTLPSSLILYPGSGGTGGNNPNVNWATAEILPGDVSLNISGQTFSTYSLVNFEDGSGGALNGINRLILRLPPTLANVSISNVRVGGALKTFTQTQSTTASGQIQVAIDLTQVYTDNTAAGILFQIDFTADTPASNPGMKMLTLDVDNTQSSSPFMVPPGDANGVTADSDRLTLFMNGSSNVVTSAGAEVSPHQLDLDNPNALLQVHLKPQIGTANSGIRNIRVHVFSDFTGNSVSDMEINGVELVAGTDYSFTTGSTGSTNYVDIALTTALNDTYSNSDIWIDLTLATPSYQLFSMVQVELANGTDSYYCPPLYSINMYDLSLEVLEGTWGGNEGSISGTVYDSSTGAALTAGTVDIYENNTGTFITGVPINTDGTYYAGNLADGTYDVEVFSEGFQPGMPVTVEVNVGTNAGVLDVVQDLSLSPNISTNMLDGWVYDSGTETAVSGAQVKLVNAALSATSDTTGWFSIEGVPFNHVDFLKFAKLGYVPQYSYFFNSDQYWKLPHDFYILSTTEFQSYISQIESLYSITYDQTRGVIAGEVLDIDEAAGTATPISGVQVSVTYTDGTAPTGHTIVYMDQNETPAGPTQTATSASGLFVIVNLPPGKYTITANNGTDTFTVPTAKVFADSVTDGMIRRIPNGGISGRVTDAGGTAVSGATISAYREVTDTSGTWYQWVTDGLTDGSGNFSISGLTDGNYVLEGYADGPMYAVYDSVDLLENGTLITVSGVPQALASDFILYSGGTGDTTSNPNVAGAVAEILPYDNLALSQTAASFTIYARAFFVDMDENAKNGINQLNIGLDNTLTGITVQSVTVDGASATFTRNTVSGTNTTWAELGLSQVYKSTSTSGVLFAITLTLDTPASNPGILPVIVEFDNTSSPALFSATPGDADLTAGNSEQLSLSFNGSSNVVDAASGYLDPHVVGISIDNQGLSFTFTPTISSTNTGIDLIRMHLPGFLSDLTLKDITAAGVKLQSTQFTAATSTTTDGQLELLITLSSSLDSSYSGKNIVVKFSVDTPFSPYQDMIDVYLESGSDSYIVPGQQDIYDLGIEVSSDTFGSGGFNQGAVSGMVTDSATEAAITGTDGYIDVFDPAVGTYIAGTPINTDGTFYIGGLPAGSFELEARAIGYDPMVGYPITIESTEISVSLTLTPQTAAQSLYGHVEDVEVGTAVASANVELIISGSSTVTDTNGDFSFTDLPQYVKELAKASKVGYKNTYSRFFTTGSTLSMFLPLVSDTQYTQITTDLSADSTLGVIAGQVMNDMGPVSGVTVRAYPVLADGSIGTTTVGRIVYSTGTATVKPGETQGPLGAPLWDTSLRTTGTDGMFLIVDVPLGRVEVTVENTFYPYPVRRTKTFPDSICFLDFTPFDTSNMPFEIFEIAPPASATTGGKCTLYGSSFGPGMTVTIGGSYSCPVTVLSPMQCEIDVPAMPSSDYQGVEATLPDGRSAYYDTAFYVRPVASLSTTLSIPAAQQATDVPLQYQYRMISIPAFYVQGFDHLFEDILGPYDPYVWRASRWDGFAGRYIEYDEAKAHGHLGFHPGDAFWVITWKGASFVPQGFSLPASSYHCTIYLNPGWNQIGNPFSENLAWGSAKVRNPQTGSEYYLSDSRIYDGSVATQMSLPFEYDGNGGYLISEHLAPGTGYWVKNNSANELTLVLGEGGSNKAYLLKSRNKSTEIPEAAYNQKFTPPSPPGADAAKSGSSGGGGGGCFISTLR